MSNILCCPKCGQKTIQMINHTPLDMSEYPFDTHLYGTFQCLQMHCHEVFKAVLNVSFKQEPHPMEEINDISKAIIYLKSKGYYTDNLWCIDDVKMGYECTDEEAMKVLADTFTNDATYSTIWEQLDNAAFNNNLNKL